MGITGVVIGKPLDVLLRAVLTGLPKLKRLFAIAQFFDERGRFDSLPRKKVFAFSGELAFC